MTWGCISTFGFHDFILLDGTMDAAGYVIVLKDNLLPVICQYFKEDPCIFQQDEASPHTAHEVAGFFNAHNMQVLEWPPHSPDLNIIDQSVESK